MVSFNHWLRALSLSPSLVAAADLTSNLIAIAESGLDTISSSTKSQLQDISNTDNQRTGLNRCQIACAALSIVLPKDYTAVGKLNYSPIPYWSVQQSEVVPACRIDVSSAKSISITVQIASLLQCPFNVRGGGHAAFAGGSSVKDGILINLTRLDTVVLSKDRQTASIGPGNTWYDVYSKLDPLGVSVVGGREAGVGVSGLTLGGGISYFSGRFGWACDNVRSYEVVLASGQIVNASPSKHTDLYWALRGGAGSNFGIVSRFDLMAFEQGLLWGGSTYHPSTADDALATAFESFNNAAPTDPYAHLYIAYVYALQLGGFIGITGPAYGKPVAYPPIFSKIKGIPASLDTTHVASMTTLAVELNQTAHQRQLFKTITLKNSASLIKDIVKIYREEANSVLDVEGLFPALAFQSLSTNIIQQMQKNGGNALGLSADRAPLMIMNYNWGWNLAKDDARVEAAATRLRNRALALAKSRSLDDPFIYINYASIDAPVYQGYGPMNLAKLKAVKAKYDPMNVFGRLWRGYFKL